MWQLNLHFIDGDVKLLRGRSGKQLIAVQHGSVMTFDQQWHLLKQRVGLFCDSDLQGNKCKHETRYIAHEWTSHFKKIFFNIEQSY